MRTFLKKNKAAIISSVLACIVFVYLLDPLMGFFTSVVLKAASRVNQGYIDKICAQASILETQNYAYIWLTMVLLLVVFGVFATIIQFFVRTFWPQDPEKRYPDDVALDCESTEENNEPSSETRRSSEGPPTEPVVSMDVQSWNLHLRRAAAALLLLLGITMLAWGGAAIIANRIQLEIMASFEQHMRIVAPYIDEQKEEDLLSLWSQMKSEQDYITVREELASIADANGVSLPSNAIYSVFAF